MTGQVWHLDIQTGVETSKIEKRKLPVGFYLSNNLDYWVGPFPTLKEFLSYVIEVDIFPGDFIARVEKRFPRRTIVTEYK